MIKVDKDLCIGCSACVSICPTNSLMLNDDNQCECDNETCVKCLACISTCPVNAILEDEDVEKEEPKEINIEEINANKQLLHFYAEWCGPCKMLEPILKEVENDIEIIHINVDKEEDMAKEYDVMSIPTLILLKDEKEVERNVGLCDLQFLKDFISK